MNRPLSIQRAAVCTMPALTAISMTGETAGRDECRVHRLAPSFSADRVHRAEPVATAGVAHFLYSSNVPMAASSLCFVRTIFSMA